MREKELFQHFDLPSNCLSTLTKYLAQNGIKHSFTITGALMIDDALAMQVIPKFKKDLENGVLSDSNQSSNAIPIHEPTFEEKLQEDIFTFSSASSRDLPYVVYQVTLKEKFWGTGSGNLEDLENIINHFYNKGYRLHTMSTATSDGSKGFGGGDRIQATLVFEKIGLFK